MLEFPRTALRRPGGEGRVRGADEPVRGTVHLTLPPLRDGSLFRAERGSCPGGNILG
jgi:hypothetical protein